MKESTRIKGVLIYHEELAASGVLMATDPSASAETD
jgi:hypothetical protein